MAYSERLLENQERLSMRDMRLRVAKLILRGVASSTIAQAEGYPSYTARELSSYFSYSSISIVVNLNLNMNYYYYYYYRTISSRGLRRGAWKKIFFSRRKGPRSSPIKRLNRTEWLPSARDHSIQGTAQLVRPYTSYFQKKPLGFSRDLNELTCRRRIHSEEYFRRKAWWNTTTEYCKLWVTVFKMQRSDMGQHTGNQ